MTQNENDYDSYAGSLTGQLEAIYRTSREEVRWGAAFPGNVVPMCMIRGKCADFRAFTTRRASPARCVRRQHGGRCCSPTGARCAFRGLGNIRVGSCVCTLHDGAAADNTLISVASVTLTCGSVGLPMREEPPLSAARAYRGATARSDVRVPQLPASGPGHSPWRVSARGEWHGRSESRPS
jgi:hypothetical protein